MDLDLEPPYLVVKPGLSEDDFYRLAGEDSDWEYLDGRIVMHSPASFQHENLFRFLLTLVSGFLDERGGGIVLGSRYPMRLDARWSPEPDLLFIRDARRGLLTSRCLEGAADAVVEIVSESDPGLVSREKLPRYREAGVPEIWVVDPFRQEVLVDRAEGAAREALRLSSGRLESTAIPGFWIDAGWLWRMPLPSAMSCLRDILEGSAR